MCDPLILNMRKYFHEKRYYSVETTMKINVMSTALSLKEDQVNLQSRT